MPAEVPLDRWPFPLPGLMVRRVPIRHLCPTARGPRRESAVEIYYGAGLRPWLWLKPDVQYILDPGAGGTEDAIVGTLRMVVSL